MRPDDETRGPSEVEDEEAADGATGDGAGPATWAGRNLAGPPDNGSAEETTTEPPEDADHGDDGAEHGDTPEEPDPEVEEADAEPDEPDADGDAAQTVEADTLSLADREAAQEAALAGLRARTDEHPAHTAEDAEDAGEAEVEPEPEPEAEKPSQGPPVPVAAAEDEDAKRPGAKRLWPRFLAASLLIVISVAAATSISLLVYLTDIAKGLGDHDALAGLREQLQDADGGAPQTILILGSDKRQDTQGDPGRSDTTILLRVDPDKDAIALLSIPRDLKVYIPGIGQNKFNAAYTAGGPDLTLRVVKQLTGLQINHVVNINFTGFADAVNAIDGVYVDVDRQYYVPEGSGYAAIDPPINAGYQLMKGLKALQYVRFRHDDNDLVRSARQQDFLREARQKLPPGVLVRDRNELLRIFTEYTTSDIGEAVPLLELLKTFAGVQAAPVREVHFPADLGDGTSGYVTASDEGIKQAVDQFLNTAGTPGERPAGEPDQSDSNKPGGGKGGDKKSKPGGDHFEGPAMDDSTAIGQQYAQTLQQTKRKDGDPMVDFPIYYPTRVAPGSTIDDYSRAFVIDGPDKDVYHGYKFVVEFPGPAGFTEYYGVSGTGWIDAPILDNPSETRTIDGRDYELFYDGDRLRLVGWKTKDAAYWVSNSLLQALDDGELLSIATSMRELGG